MNYPDFLTGEDGEFILTMTDMNGNVTFYSYDGWRFYLTKKQPTDGIFNNAVTTSFIHINTKSESQTLLAIQPDDTVAPDVNNVYSLQFKQVFPNFDLLESTLQTVQEMNHTIYHDLLPRSNSFNTSFNLAKDNIVFLEDVIKLTGIICSNYFEGVVIIMYILLFYDIFIVLTLISQGLLVAPTANSLIELLFIPRKPNL